jgi:ABC-type uncharacterized transport system substrate-binding protein
MGLFWPCTKPLTPIALTPRLRGLVIHSTTLSRSCLWSLVLLGVLCWVSPVPAAEHVALVIGNADYKEAPLRNPLNDVHDVSRVLRALRFEVFEVTNINRRKMIETVNDFGTRLQQAQVGLFYYSGHGVQYHGNNYLIPLHAVIQTPTDLEYEAMDVRRVLGHMQQGATELNIVILDACRDNPFKNLIAFRGYGERGLARPPSVRSALIAYATQPDNTAADGTGRNGTYTKHLLQHLKRPGLTLPDLFSDVGRGVLQETNGQQEPWVSFSPLPRFCFAGCEPFSPPVSVPQVSATPTSAPRSNRIGILGPLEEPRFSEVRDGLQQGLRDQGYKEQAIELLEARVTRGDQEQVQAAVTGFLQQRVRVLVVIGSELVKLVREVSSELPIVYLTPGDPVEQGLAASLARPGGHTTAMTFEYPELAGKRLELLQETLPQVRRVLILYDPRDGSSRQGAAAAREAAPKLGLTLVERAMHSRDDITHLEALAEVEAFLVILGGLPTSHYAEIIRAANAKRVATVFHARTRSTMEALVSYGASDEQIARQLARYVAKILTGVKAGDLPVERPMKLELVINLKIAKQIGVTIPSEVLMQANQLLR